MGETGDQMVREACLPRSSLCSDPCAVGETIWPHFFHATPRYIHVSLDLEGLKYVYALAQIYQANGTGRGRGWTEKEERRKSWKNVGDSRSKAREAGKILRVNGSPLSTRI